jgi:hypothetical protein
VPDSHFGKYARQLADLDLSPEEYAATYSQPIVITPTRFLPWHGRTTPPSAVRRPSLADRVFGWLPRLLPGAPGRAGTLGAEPTLA